MRPEDADLARIWDMRQAALDAVEILGDANLQQFQTEKALYRGVERSVELIGEAASRVSTDFRSTHPDVPWAEIVGQRNILAHDYGQIDYVILFNTVQRDLPSLLAILEKILEHEG